MGGVRFVIVVSCFLSLYIADVTAVRCYLSTTASPFETDCTDVNNPCLNFTTALASPSGCRDILPFGGIYTGVDNRNLDTNWPLVVEAYNGSVVIDCESSGRFIQLSQDSTAISNWTLIFRDITIRNGQINNNNGGAGLRLELTNPVGYSSAEPAVLDGVVIENCAAQAGSPSGAGIYSINVPLILRRSNFTGNSLTCTSGGSVECHGGAIRVHRQSNGAVPNVLVEDCLFQGNTLSNTDSSGDLTGGAAIALGQGFTPPRQLTIRRSKFLDNTVFCDSPFQDSTRGAIEAYAYNVLFECGNLDSAECVVSGNRIVALNSGVNDPIPLGGAGITMLENNDISNLTVQNVIFSNNSVNCPTVPCSQAPFYGGGAIAGTYVYIRSCRFCNNSAENDGNGADILIYDAGHSRELDAFLPVSVFQCNETGPAIEPLGFSCTEPWCQFLAPDVDPTTGICEACLAPFASATPSPVSLFLVV